MADTTEPSVALAAAIAGREFVVRFDADSATVMDLDSTVARMTPIEPGGWWWRVETRGRTAEVRYEQSSLRERLRWSWRLVARDARDGVELGSCTPRTWGTWAFDVRLAPGHRIQIRRSLSDAIRRPVSRRWQLVQDDGTPVAVLASSTFRRFEVATSSGGAPVTELALLLLLASTALVIDSLTSTSVDAGDGGS